jgi:hypothetical protein
METSSLNFPARDGFVIKGMRNDRTVGIELLSITRFNPSKIDNDGHPVLPQHLSGFSQLDPEWWWRILSPLEAAGYTG